MRAVLGYTISVRLLESTPRWSRWVGVPASAGLMMRWLFSLLSALRRDSNDIARRAKRETLYWAAACRCAYGGIVCTRGSSTGPPRVK